MLSCCLKRRKNTESKNPVIKTKNGRIMPSPQCIVDDSKMLRFIKEQEANGLLSSLGIKIPVPFSG